MKRMFRPSEDDFCPPPHKQLREETQKRGQSRTHLHTHLQLKSVFPKLTGKYNCSTRWRFGMNLYDENCKKHENFRRK